MPNIKPYIVGALIQALRHHDANVRGNAAISLGLLRDRRASAALMNCLNDSSSDVRGHAAYALGCLGAHKAIQPLIELLDDQDKMVRVWTLASLQQMFFRRQTATLAALPAVLTALGDHDPHVRENAANLLGNIADRSTLDALIARLDDEVPDVRFAAIGALISIGDPRALPAIERLAASETATTVLGDVQEHAIEAIAYLQAR